MQADGRRFLLLIVLIQSQHISHAYHRGENTGIEALTLHTARKGLRSPAISFRSIDQNSLLPTPPSVLTFPDRYNPLSLPGPSLSKSSTTAGFTLYFRKVAGERNKFPSVDGVVRRFAVCWMRDEFARGKGEFSRMCREDRSNK